MGSGGGWSDSDPRNKHLESSEHKYQNFNHPNEHLTIKAACERKRRIKKGHGDTNEDDGEEGAGLLLWGRRGGEVEYGGDCDEGGDSPCRKGLGRGAVVQRGKESVQVA